MNEEVKTVVLNDDMKDYINELVSKSIQVMAKTKSYKNVDIEVCGMKLPVKIDDLKLFYIGAYLLPNIMNYLVNILPQFIYPYCVAYLQDLSAMRDDPVTVNELYDYLIEYNHGNIHNSPDAES